jgi:hypothetical protein
MPDPTILSRLRARHTPGEPPPCPVCGAELFAVDKMTWFCTAMKEAVYHQPPRNIRGEDLDHWVCSRWVKLPAGDPDVLALLDAYEAQGAALREAADMARKSAFQLARRACKRERLEDPQEEADAAYQQGVRDCENAIRALEEAQEAPAESERQAVCGEILQAIDAITSPYGEWDSVKRQIFQETIADALAAVCRVRDQGEER